jgi:branched-chain amino acid transport system substrate-binding protein
VTGVGADYWAGPVTYASLQVLEQSIEAVGTDRAAVTNHIKSGSFKTVLGDWKFNNQVIDQFWTVGQWQGGKFVGVASTGKTGAKSVQVKTGW